MKTPAGFAACIAVGLTVHFAGIVPVSAEGDEAKAGDGATLQQLQSIPAGEFTRIIENSTSTDKRFAVALGSKDGKKPEWEMGRYEKDGGPNGISYFLEP